LAKLTVQQLDTEIQQLPSLSLVVTEVLSILERGNVDLSTLMRKVSQDQALAARVLKVANSPFYGFSRDVGSLREAGIMLGTHTIKHIVTAVGIINHFSLDDNELFDHVAFWQHAMGTGICAKVLSRHCGFDQETAFTAGLLHDVGKLVMAAHFTEDFIQILAYRDEHDCLLKDAEASVLGFDHSLVGARIAQHWKLPPLIISAIEYHHSPGHKSSSPLAVLIHVADIVCRGLEIGNGGDTLIPAIDDRAMNLIRLNWDNVKDCFHEIEDLNASAGLLVEVGSSTKHTNREKSGERNVIAS
jgi:putative nucleotidyltransferase with HDIG domain